MQDPGQSGLRSTGIEETILAVVVVGEVVEVVVVVGRCFENAVALLLSQHM